MKPRRLEEFRARVWRALAASRRGLTFGEMAERLKADSDPLRLALKYLGRDGHVVFRGAGRYGTWHVTDRIPDCEERPVWMDEAAQRGDADDAAAWPPAAPAAPAPAGKAPAVLPPNSVFSLVASPLPVPQRQALGPVSAQVYALIAQEPAGPNVHEIMERAGDLCVSRKQVANALMRMKREGWLVHRYGRYYPADNAPPLTEEPPAAPEPAAAPAPTAVTLPERAALLDWQAPPAARPASTAPAAPVFSLDSQGTFTIETPDLEQPVALPPRVTRAMFRWLDQLAGLDLERLVAGMEEPA